MWLITGITEDDIDYLWDTLEPLVKSALENGGSLEESSSIRGAILDRTMQAWGILRGDQITGVGITTVEEWDKGRCLTVVALSGVDMVEWLPEFERTVRVFAAANGCKFVGLEGRRGWVKELQRFGWKEISVKMYKEL